MSYFLEGKTDDIKQEVLTHNKKQWTKIRPQVKEWMFNSWWRWEEEKPGWFTEAWIAKVPPDMIPSEAKAGAKGFRASARRRSSFAIVAKEEDTRRVQPDS